jgi:hypothetical protein
LLAPVESNGTLHVNANPTKTGFPTGFSFLLVLRVDTTCSLVIVGAGAVTLSVLTPPFKPLDVAWSM